MMKLASSTWFESIELKNFVVITENTNTKWRARCM